MILLNKQPIDETSAHVVELFNKHVVKVHPMASEKSLRPDIHTTVVVEMFDTSDAALSFAQKLNKAKHGHVYRIEYGPKGPALKDLGSIKAAAAAAAANVAPLFDNSRIGVMR
jgi:hypothetical protein